MDPRFLDYYERELRHLADMCAEFASEFPKVAGRLSLEGFIKEFQCPDPYVERLMEGFAYMAARVRLKVDAEYPRFSQSLLEAVYPDYLAPVPSMGVVQFQPDVSLGALNDGKTRIARGTPLKSGLWRDVQTPCEYRTAHDVTLWPVAVAEARYHGSGAAASALGVSGRSTAKALVRVRLKTVNGIPFKQLALDRLDFYLRGGDQAAMQLYEQLMAHCCGVAAVVSADDHRYQELLPADTVRPLGFGDAEALLPPSPRLFQGYRLLKEYFAFAERFMFVALSGLSSAVSRCDRSELEVLILLDRSEPVLEEAIDASRFVPFCTPVINLFPKRADRLHLTDQSNEYHIVIDRSRPLDFEVYGVNRVYGYGTRSEPEQEFLPFYACSDADQDRFHNAFFTLYREPRMLSTRQRRRGPRSSYIGSEVFIGLVDASEAPFGAGLRQLGVEALCTNRDLPLQMPVGGGRTDLALETGAPVKDVRFVAGPTEPWPSTAHREVAWKLISHLSLNYLSLTGHHEGKGAAGLRELLDLYVPRKQGDRNPVMSARIEGLHTVASRPVHRRLPIPGPPAIGRGLEVAVTFDDGGFAGSGPFLLGAVLEQFFARYVSINSFTETVLRTLTRGEIMRWPARTGQRQLI